MITTNLYRKVLAGAAKAETAAYKVLSAFHLKHVLQEVGSVVYLTVEEAKYHLLSERVAPVVAEAPAAVVAVPVAKVADKPVVTAPEADGGKK